MTASNWKNRFVLTTSCTIAISLGGGALAQAVDPVEYCRENSQTTEAEITCLRAALTGTLTIEQEQPAPQAAVSAPQPEQSAEPAQENTVPPAPPLSATAPTSPQTTAPTGIGAEQVVAKQERSSKDGRKKRKERLKKETETARILDFARTGDGRLILVLESGQVWGQIKGDKQKINLEEDETLTAEIQPSSFGGYKLRFVEKSRTIRVRRIQ